MHDKSNEIPRGKPREKETPAISGGQATWEKAEELDANRLMKL